jgi:hypothetical protein
MRLAILLFVAFCLPSRAQESDFRAEFWPELDVYVWLNDNYRIFILSALSRGREVPYSEEQIGIHLDYSFANHKQLLFRRLVDKAKARVITLRGGYRYGFSIKGSDPFRENRGILELTLRWHFRRGFLVIDRNRGDLRWINGVPSQRYRNRLTVERENRPSPVFVHSLRICGSFL